MSDQASHPGERRERYFMHPASLAAFAAGLAAAFAGAWLLRPAPTPTPEPPGAAATSPIHVAPAADVELATAPPASLADIARMANDFDRYLALYRLAAGLDAAGVERLLAEAGTLDRASERDPPMWVLYARYMDLAPESALRHVLAGDAAAERRLHFIFHLWARTDLAAALRHAQTLNRRQRGIAGAAILQARGDLPPETKAEIAAQLAPQGNLQAVVARQSLAYDPAHAWHQALAREPGKMRNEALEHVAFHWGRTDPRAALAAIDSASEVDQRTRDELRGSVVSSWADADPAAAMDWAMAQPASQSRRAMVDRALRAWSEAAPRAAAAWLNAPENRAAAAQPDMVMVARNYATRHPEEAVDWLLALPAEVGSNAMLNLFSALAQKDPGRAVRLLQRVGDAGARRHATRGLFFGLVRADPTAALPWVDRLSDGDSDQRDVLTATLLMEWAETDAAAAVRYLDRLTEPQLRDRSIVAMLDSVLRYDVSLAETLFDRLESDDAREEAARKLREHLSKTDPDRAERYR